MKNKKSIINIFILFIFFAILIVLYNNQDSQKLLPYIIEDRPIVVDNGSNETIEKVVATKNNNIVGNIKINGTNINYPIVQGNDNEYYLNHTPENKKDPKGSIFLDYRNNLEDRKLLIYGHNSKTIKTALFYDLGKYTDYPFYKNHKYISLYINDYENEYEIFSVMIVKGNKHTKIVFNDKEFVKHIDWMKSKSIYDTGVNVGMTDQILTLQTCYYKPADSFLLINAKKIK